MNSIHTFKRVVLRLSVIVAGLLMIARTHALDVLAYGVLKGQSFFQFSSGTPPAGLGTLYTFRAFVDASAPNAISDARVKPPGNAGEEALSAAADAKQLTFEEQFNSATEL